MDDDTAAPQSEWRQGWPLAIAACAGMTLGPLPTYTMGLLMAPLEQEFQWSRALISSGLTVTSITGVLLSPFVGIAVDRMGPRRVAITGLLLFAAAFAALSLTNGSKIRWYANWGLIAFGVAMLTPTVWTAAVASRFTQARGLAMAIALCGAPITAILAPQAANALLSSFGWRAVYLGMALLWAAIVLPLLLLFFFGAHDVQRRKGNSIAHEQEIARLPGVSLRQAFTSTIFLRLALVAFLTTAMMSASIVHLVPLLTMRGIDRDAALLLMSVVGVGGLIGRLLGGAMLDRMNPRLFGALAFALPAVAFLSLLPQGLSLFPAVIIAVILGLGSGAEIEVSSFLTARYFGLRHYGTMFGTIAGLMLLGAGVGPVLAGVVFDLTGTYDIALMLAAPTGLLNGALIFSLPRDPLPNAVTKPELQPGA